ncbi:hypothetical protein PG993_015035 [Apiospora rasikravindrae]|uniref:Uncharacterized protein n=1 Tax=Apiospora rasikravindrae TaxID=990691 RepID=A0ABR1RPE8_9PEZI
MKFSTVSVLAFAIPALSAAIGNVSLPIATPDKREFTAVDKFPTRVVCPRTEAETDGPRTFTKDYMESAARIWLNSLNDRKKPPSDQVKGYPARYSVGVEGAPGRAGKFAENTKKMEFSADCLAGYMWEMPMLVNGEPWKPAVSNGAVGNLRLYYLAAGGTATFCGAGVHAYPDEDKERAWMFERCVPEYDQ